MLVMLAVALGGCIDSGPSAEELKVMMIDSLVNLDSYKFTMDTKQSMEITDFSDASGPREMKMTVASHGVGAINLTGRAMWMTANTTTSSEDMGDVSNVMEMYFIGDTIYMGLDKNWTQLKMPFPEEAWGQQNQVKHQMELLNQSDIKLVGSEKIDGTSCYRVEVIPDMGTYSIILEEQFGSMPLAGVNMTALYENSEMEWTVWLAKDTNMPRKIEVSMMFTMTPELIGLPAEEIGDFEMSTDVVTLMLFSDYNQPLEITLPEDAKNAVSLPLFPMLGAPTAA